MPSREQRPAPLGSGARSRTHIGAGAPRGTGEFFTVRTVSEALTGFRPARRTPVERIGLDDALGRVPAEALVAPHALPGFARATVDGYAVRAADTYGASEGLPSYLDLVGEALMGRPPESEVRPGTAVAIATGAPLPPGADAVLKVEHTQTATAELIEVMRPVTPGEGMVRADEDAAPGAELAPAGRPLRAHDLGMLAAAGLVEIPAYARPRVIIVSTGDELVPAAASGPDSPASVPASPASVPDSPGSGPAALPAGQVRDSSAPALAALVREAGGSPEFAGIVPDDRDALVTKLREALPECDILVISAGSSVGARDPTAAASP
ncbi:MAG: molybdopterin molybdotransferase [Thermoleophilaceae bacterium]|nr:molybdopterin molybdotransferase [Thermoleophilaceae bacterium]